MVRVKHIIWLFLVSWMMIACQQEKHDRCEDDTNSLLSIEDSMEVNPQFARKKIDDGMKNAPGDHLFGHFFNGAVGTVRHA